MSLSVSPSISVAVSCRKGRVVEREKEVEPTLAGDAVAASANSFSLLPEGFIRLPKY